MHEEMNQNKTVEADEMKPRFYSKDKMMHMSDF